MTGRDSLEAFRRRVTFLWRLWRLYRYFRGKINGPNGRNYKANPQTPRWAFKYALAYARKGGTVGRA